MIAFLDYRRTSFGVDQSIPKGIHDPIPCLYNDNLCDMVTHNSDSISPHRFFLLLQTTTVEPPSINDCYAATLGATLTSPPTEFVFLRYPLFASNLAYPDTSSTIHTVAPV